MHFILHQANKNEKEKEEEKISMSCSLSPISHNPNGFSLNIQQ
jgi:hypothetical protein